MLRRRLIIGIVLLALLGATAGCVADLGQSPGSEGTSERAVEETIAVTEQPAEEVSALEQLPAEADALDIKGWVSVDAYHYDEATGTYVQFYHDESSNLITTIGLNWIETQLGSTSTADPAKYISVSASTSSPLVGWTDIPSEIAAGGLSRGTGTYSSTGDGAWNIVVTFNSTATHSNVQLTGLHWSTGASNLMAANTFTPVTLGNGDTLTVTWQLSVS